MSIEKIYKNVSGFISQCLNTCLSVIEVVVRSKFGVSFPKASEEACIVLGNGPSLKVSFQNYPDFFKKHSLICVNSFSVTEQYIQLRPKYYVMLDPGFWLGSGELVNNTINNIKIKTTWELNLFVPPAAKKSILFQQLLKENNNIKVVYFNYIVFKGFKSIAHLFYKKNLAMPQSQNVMVASVFLGINMGFEKIFLVGADHSWHEQLHVTEENILCVKQIHFYDNAEKATYTPFFKGVHRNEEVFTMDEILVLFSKAFYGYRVLNRYAKSRNCEIFNASEVSYIDAFKRIKLKNDRIV